MTAMPEKAEEDEVKVTNPHPYTYLFNTEAEYAAYLEFWSDPCWSEEGKEA